jgi:hypothetical protein
VKRKWAIEKRNFGIGFWTWTVLSNQRKYIEFLIMLGPWVISSMIDSDADNS